MGLSAQPADSGKAPRPGNGRAEKVGGLREAGPG